MLEECVSRLRRFQTIYKNQLRERSLAPPQLVTINIFNKEFKKIVLQQKRHIHAL